jgi:DNA-binding transcriptional MocR family regulator
VLDTFKVKSYIVTMTIWQPRLKPGHALTAEIVAALARDIDHGRLAPGTRLPTHRELAGSLGVAIGTVTRAYAQAKVEGLVSGTVGRGMFVAGKPEEEARAADSQTIDLSQNFVCRDPRDAAIRKTLAGFGDPAELAPMLDGDQSPEGCERHRAAGAQWIARSGLEVRAGRIVVTNGVQHAMFLALAMLAKPGDAILAEQVTYVGLKAIASMLHLLPRGLPMDGDGLRADAFEQACAAGARILYTVPTLQNPVGCVMPLRRRREIVRIARRYDVTILEDDVYGFVTREHVAPIASLAPERCYFLTGASKSIAMGLRVGYMACPEGMQRQMAAAVRTTVWEAAPLMAELMTKWIGDGTADRVVEWKRAEIEARHGMALRILGDFAAKTAAPSCHLWIALQAPWRNDDFVAQCRSRGVIVSPADAFVVDREPAPHAIRICLGSVSSRDRLEPALRLIADLLGRPQTGFALT